MKYIPNYGEADAVIYDYHFTEGKTEAGKQFSYRLEMLSWGGRKQVCIRAGFKRQEVWVTGAVEAAQWRY